MVSETSSDTVVSVTESRVIVIVRAISLIRRDCLSNLCDEGACQFSCQTSFMMERGTARTAKREFKLIIIIRVHSATRETTNAYYVICDSTEFNSRSYPR